MEVISMDEYSFDVVSKVDMQEISNAIVQTMKEISQRFDFKGSKSNIEMDKGKQELTIISDDDYKLLNVIDILQGKLVKRKVPLKALSYGKIEPAHSGTVKQHVVVQQGVPIEKAKEMVKEIKNSKLKVQAEIQQDQLRIRAKKKDDLQSVINLLKGKDFGIHLDFVNYR